MALKRKWLKSASTEEDRLTAALRELTQDYVNGNCHQLNPDLCDRFITALKNSTPKGKKWTPERSAHEAFYMFRESLRSTILPLQNNPLKIDFKNSIYKNSDQVYNLLRDGADIACRSRLEQAAIRIDEESKKPSNFNIAVSQLLEACAKNNFRQVEDSFYQNVVDASYERNKHCLLKDFDKAGIIIYRQIEHMLQIAKREDFPDKEMLFKNLKQYNNIFIAKFEQALDRVLEREQKRLNTLGHEGFYTEHTPLQIQENHR